jgi:hypothetical protein
LIITLPSRALLAPGCAVGCTRKPEKFGLIHRNCRIISLNGALCSVLVDRFIGFFILRRRYIMKGGAA